MLTDLVASEPVLPRNAAMPQSSGLRGHQQPPLPLVQMRGQHRELHSKLITSLVRDAHTTSTSPGPESKTLVIGKPLACAGAASPIGALWPVAGRADVEVEDGGGQIERGTGVGDVDHAAEAAFDRGGSEEQVGLLR